jgi:hypothetical protein
MKFAWIISKKTREEKKKRRRIIPVIQSEAKK